MPAALTLHIDGLPTSHRIRRADTWWRRAVGLLTTTALHDPCGLWIAPCGSVHTFGMRYAIDVVFLDRDNRVLKVVPRLRPWRMAGAARAVATLELREGLAEPLGLRPGLQLSLAA